MPAPIAYYRALIRRPPRWPKIAVPTLHLHGEQDGGVGYEMSRGQERLFDGRFESQVLGGVGHFLHMERPDLVAARIMEWVA
jgi:pimeloyl-ACP methyl ester carboxylesterase